MSTHLRFVARFARRVALSVMLVAVASPPAEATDGVTEINQAAALAGSVTPGDAPGFPVQLTSGGSFRLTGNLAVPNGASAGIVVQASGTRIDLNAFSIASTNQCTGSPPVCTGTGATIGIDAESVPDVGVRNGRIAGFIGLGISLSDLGTAENLTLDANGGGGVVAGAASVVANNIVRNSESIAIQVGNASRVVANVVHNNVQGVIAPSSALVTDNVITGNAAPSVIGGAHARGNLCDDHRCPSLRLFYKTVNAVQGGAALTACDPGFHMASRFEIEDVSNLAYDTVRGWSPPAGNDTTNDQGFGPPTGFPGAWIRTGSFIFSGSLVGVSHCNAWKLSSGTGTTASLIQVWTPGTPPWSYNTLGCSSTAQVWCVED